MDMATTYQDQVVFHLTGKPTADGLLPVDATLRPALLAAYRDLSRLRYDFPLVLLDDLTQPDYVASVGTLVNRVLTELASRGIEGERLRRQVLRLERELRALLAAGEHGTLSALWAKAAARVDPNGDTAPVLARVAHALRVDGPLVDCDAALPERLIRQAWRAVHAEKAREFRTLTDHLVRKLSDIQRAAFMRSAAGREPAALQVAVGTLHADAFDFDAMSRLVRRGAPQDDLPAARRARIDWALATLRNQNFYNATAVTTEGAAALPFEYADCASAAAAYRERLPRMVEVVKAIAVAELEVAGRYVEADHDAFFERYGPDALTAADLAQFPDYLVCIPPDRTDAPENAGLMGLLSAGLPLKVLVIAADLLEDAAIGTGQFAFGVRCARLATTAMALGGMFVLQSPSSNLYALRERVRHGMRCREPALFSVFAGTPAEAATLPAYLSAAAAMDARAFPAFTYDAAAGDNWATRFSLENNRARDADWPQESFDYADGDLQRTQATVAFTFADFALCDRRYARHFAQVPGARWNAAMCPVADWLALPERDRAERIPYVWAVDADDRLQRVIVDQKLLQATRRCLQLWQRLQEHAGINDSHAPALLARERAVWEASRPLASTVPAPTEPAPAATRAGPLVPAASPAIDDAKRSSDEAWIETARCPSCNECQTINPQMFAYNENKQAFIKDITAGTFRQLVEAAEACQVAIIHPGKPRNPAEPGLAELIERAAPYQ
jgi:ferredoxin